MVKPEANKLRVTIRFEQTNCVGEGRRITITRNYSDVKSILIYIADNLFFRFCIVCCVFLRRSHWFPYVSIPPSTCNTCPVM